MTVVLPEGTPTLGNTKVAACVAVVDLEAPKVATEISAVTSLDASGYLYPAGWNPTGSTAKGTAMARLASTRQKERLNRTTYSLPNLQYVHDPQGDDSDPGNEAREMFVEGVELFIVERIGLDADVAWATGQRTITHHIRLGAQIDSGDRTDENGEFFIEQAVVYVNDGPVRGVTAA